MIAFLTSQSVNDWTAEDIHGNTPLHYIASNRSTTPQTIAEGLAQEKVRDAWSERITWGHTLLDLLKDRQTALEELAPGG
jgi:hypothetical protein